MANNSFDIFVKQFSEKLKLPLPGELSHQRMQASSRNKLNFKPNERTRRSAILILFYPYQNDIYFPVILRPPYDGVHSGQIAFPGGRQEPTDRDLVQTALREAQEEIGLRLNEVKVLGQLSQLFIPPSNFNVLPVVACTPSRPSFYPDPREVADIYEIPFSEIIKQEIIGSSQIIIRGEPVTAPYYKIDNKEIWGATAMMISELLDVYQTFQAEEE
ncbi:NUDIX hydrolase [Dyadobacter tibetensis]|uniref:NUDIX hydrolase n=1 Tax=Dyadobacter tibetensis TaxID=1211851 RepID=UPI00046F3ED2|nr:CoA pyrophosphatase [Dyadobacter tibetensis]